MSLTQIRRKTGTHSAIKIRRFFCYFIFVIYFCTTRNRESCCFSSAVEHFLGKEEVPGSSPGNSSKKRGCLTNRRHPLYLFLFVLLSRNHFRICDSRKIKNLPAPLQPQRDSNPRYSCPYTAFRVRPDRPLRHLSRSITNPSAGNSECKYSYFSQKKHFRNKKRFEFLFSPAQCISRFYCYFCEIMTHRQ